MTSCPIPSPTRTLCTGVLALVQQPLFALGMSTLTTFTAGRKLLTNGSQKHYALYAGALCAAQVAALGYWFWIDRPRISASQ